jgi:two-component system, sensor histidine kinase and response regulator
MGNTTYSRHERILVVEDHPESAELLQMILENDGYEARCVNTGRDALRVFAAQSADITSNWSPDLILLDLRLPDMSGLEVARELQKNQPSIPPVIFLSADSPQILRNVASSVGAAAIRKPFNFDDLYRAIEGELGKRRGSGRRR